MDDPGVRMEAHGATPGLRDTWGGTARKRPPLLEEPLPGASTPGADPFRLGFRHRLRATADGRETIEQIPLGAGGQLVFALEVVSTSEKEIEKKDTDSNVERYAKEEVAEYFTVYPIRERRVKNLVGRSLEKGAYADIPPDSEGRVYSEKLDLFFQIDAHSEELVAIDAQTSQRLLISDEEEAGRKKAEAALEVAEAARKKAEAALEVAEAARKQEAEARRQQAERTELGLRRKIEDLCGLLDIEWTGERSTVVAGLGSAQLEALWADLLSQKRWP